MDVALYNSPTGSNREKNIQSQKPTDSFSLYFWLPDFQTIFAIVLQANCIQVDSSLLLPNDASVGNSVIKVLWR